MDDNMGNVSVAELMETDPELRELVDELAKQDQKIKQTLAMTSFVFLLADLYKETRQPENLENPLYIETRNHIENQYIYKFLKSA